MGGVIVSSIMLRLFPRFVVQIFSSVVRINRFFFDLNIEGKSMLVTVNMISMKRWSKPPPDFQREVRNQNHCRKS